MCVSSTAATGLERTLDAARRRRVVGRGQVAAVPLREVRLLGGQELGGKIVGLVVGVATLAGLAVLELCVGGKEALMVSRAAEGLLAPCLKGVSASRGRPRGGALRDRMSVCGL